KTGLTKQMAAKAFDAVIDTLVEGIEKGERIAIPSLGVFKVVVRKPRKGRNPRTGKEIKIPARKVVAFKPAVALKEKINKQK
ncbi:MAG: HU family DNA-binding protein, partial [Candidatus Aenigmatarchaeota archaeon]